MSRMYWKKHYQTSTVVKTNNLQSNVGRTVKGKPISEKKWRQTLSYIIDVLDINMQSKVVELCCGNGEIIRHISKICGQCEGVDFSKDLLDQLSENDPQSRVQTYHADVMEHKLSKNSYDIIIIYFSIQHFNEKETIQLIQKSYKALRTNGRILVGDIPNIEKKWEYIDTPSHQVDYLQRCLENRPLIGTWFHKKFFASMENILSSSRVEILDQPNFLINQEIRFDALITKIKL